MELSNKPKNVSVVNGNAKSWFYEEPKGLEIVVEIPKKMPGGRDYKDYVHLSLPWKTIQASLKRKDS